MEILDKETYFLGEAEETSAIGFLSEIESVRNRHLFPPNPERTALLIMDMQDFFFNVKSHAFIPSASAIINRIIRIKERCRELNMPVIYTRHLNSAEDAGQMGRWWSDILTRENEMSRIIDGLYEPGNLIVEKSQYNAFFKTDLEGILRGNNISQIIISGVMTHLCCETTAREAYVRDFDVYFGIDFTATYNREFHRSTLVNLSHGFAVPVLAGELMKMLE